MKSGMIKCGIFDADGTLIDSMEMWKDITYEYAVSKGITPPEGLHRTLNSLSMQQCALYYSSLGVPGTVEEIVAELSQWAIAGYSSRVGEKPNAADFLKLLHENGIKIGVATASSTEGVTAALKHCGMLGYVDYIVSCSQVGKSKEHPDVFLCCAQEFGAVPRECVVFEDSAYAAETAAKAGFPVVAVGDSISLDARGLRDRLEKTAARYITDYNQLIQELTPPEENFGGELARLLEE